MSVEVVEIAKVVIERDRYRAALEEIAHRGFPSSWDDDGGAWEWIDAVQDIVKAALSPLKE